MFPLLVIVSPTGLQLVLKDVMGGCRLVRQGLRCVDRALAVFKANPLWAQELLKAQNVERPNPLIYWGDTRWNSKVSALKRLVVLAHTVNFILLSKGGQTATYRILDEELVSMGKAVQFLEPMCTATDVAQTDSSTMRDMWVQLQVFSSFFSHFSPIPPFSGNLQTPQ